MGFISLVSRRQKPTLVPGDASLCQQHDVTLQVCAGWWDGNQRRPARFAGVSSASRPGPRVSSAQLLPPPGEGRVQARHTAQAARHPAPGEASPQPALRLERSTSSGGSTYLGVRGLHLLVHLQRVMVQPHLHKHLQEHARVTRSPAGEPTSFPPRLLGKRDPLQDAVRPSLNTVNEKRLRGDQRPATGGRTAQLSVSQRWT